MIFLKFIVIVLMGCPFGIYILMNVRPVWLSMWMMFAVYGIVYMFVTVMDFVLTSGEV